MKGPIQSVEVSYLVHATESPELLKAAVVAVVGPGSETQEDVLEGHFGNRIVRVVHRLTGEDASMALRRLLEAAEPSALEEARSHILDLTDEHSALFLRFNKQSFFSRRLKLAESDPVRVRAKPRLFMLRGGAVEFFRQELEDAAHQ